MCAIFGVIMYKDAHHRFAIESTQAIIEHAEKAGLDQWMYYTYYSFQEDTKKDVVDYIQSLGYETKEVYLDGDQQPIALEINLKRQQL